MKRVLAILLVLCMVVPMAACGKGGDTTVTTTAGDTATTTTVADSDAVDTDVTTDSNATTTTVTDKNGNVVTTTTKKGDTTVRTKKSTVAVATNTVVPEGQTSTMGKITIKAGTTPIEKGLNFGGKEFSFAYYGSTWDQKHTDWHAAFQKKFNVKLDVHGVASDEYVAGLSSAIAAGTPYDIVFMYNFDYPSQIIANTMAPLNDYVTTADLWSGETQSGFSEALMQALSLNGNIYCVAGPYLQGPTMLWYNKKLFSDAGYDGAQDPLALYKAGKWSWDTLYDMLYDIQDPAKGLWGINSLAPYYSHQMINSFDTDYVKLAADGRLMQNLQDPNLYAALQMLQKFSYGEHKVADPNNPYEPGIEQFLNGTIASVTSTAGKYGTWYERMSKKTYSAFGSKAQQLSNIGVVPLPGKNGVVPVWDWMGYGAGNGTTKEGILCAMAFAKHDSEVNHAQVYDVHMPADMKKLCCSLMDSDKLRAPLSGFESSAGTLGNLGVQITSAVALKGQNITVTLKGYENLVQTLIDTALKG